MARTNLTTRMDSIEARFDRLESLLIAALEPKAPAVQVTPVAAPKAPKARQPKAAKKLTRKNRAEFVKAAPWAQGVSTKAIAGMCVEDPTLLPKGWVIGEGYQALVG